MRPWESVRRTPSRGVGRRRSGPTNREPVGRLGVEHRAAPQAGRERRGQTCPRVRAVTGANGPHPHQSFCPTDRTPEPVPDRAAFPLTAVPKPTGETATAVKSTRLHAKQLILADPLGSFGCGCARSAARPSPCPTARQAGRPSRRQPLRGRLASQRWPKFDAIASLSRRSRPTPRVVFRQPRASRAEAHLARRAGHRGLVRTWRACRLSLTRQTRSSC
jgi:hypothetical protein